MASFGNGKNPVKTGGIGDNKVSDTSISNSVVKNENSPQKMNVSRSMTIESVLDLNSRGTELYFDTKEDFFVLDESSVRSLSQANRTRYSIARQYHDNWRGQADQDFAEAFKVDREFVGSARDKLYDIDVRDNMKFRWTRPDRVSANIAKGYKILSPDEARSFQGAKGSRHEISQNGKTELVLMGVEKSIYDKRQREKTEKNLNRENSWKGAGVEQLSSQGGRGFVDPSASTGNYSEIVDE